MFALPKNDDGPEEKRPTCRGPVALSMTAVEGLPVQSDSDCPAVEAVQVEVRELTTPEQRRGVPSDAAVVIADHGDRIAVAITRDGKRAVRVYQDAARDCGRRAHFVSVLVVVSLMPPDLGSEPEPEPVASPEPPPLRPSPPQPAEQRRERRRVRIELAARGDVSTPIGDSARVASSGGALGVALGAGDLRLTLGIGYAPRTRLRYTGSSAGSADLERLDVALGVRLPLSHTVVDATLDAGLLITRAELRGVSSQNPSEDNAVAAGGRFGLHACWNEQSLVSPFLGAYVSAFPFAPAISQLPQGTVGHLPYVWLGLSGGLSLAL
jgi:hypothetical protein